VSQERLVTQLGKDNMGGGTGGSLSKSGSGVEEKSRKGGGVTRNKSPRASGGIVKVKEGGRAFKKIVGNGSHD